MSIPLATTARVGDKIGHYLVNRRREEAFDLSGPELPRLHFPPKRQASLINSYPSQYDRNLKFYFKGKKNRAILTHFGDSPVKKEKPADKEEEENPQMKKMKKIMEAELKKYLKETAWDQSCRIYTGRPVSAFPKPKPFSGSYPLLRSRPNETISVNETRRILNNASQYLSNVYTYMNSERKASPTPKKAKKKRGRSASDKKKRSTKGKEENDEEETREITPVQDSRRSSSARSFTRETEKDDFIQENSQQQQQQKEEEKAAAEKTSRSSSLHSEHNEKSSNIPLNKEKKQQKQDEEPSSQLNDDDEAEETTRTTQSGEGDETFRNDNVFMLADIDDDNLDSQRTNEEEVSRQQQTPTSPKNSPHISAKSTDKNDDDNDEIDENRRRSKTKPPTSRNNSPADFQRVQLERSADFI